MESVMTDAAGAMKAPIRSMTGYATVRRSTDAGDLNISLRSVNHRGLDLHFHHSNEFTPFESNVRETLKQHLSRGHVEVRTSLERGRNHEVAIDRRALTRYAAAFREVASELGVPAQPDVNTFLQLPGVLAPVDRIAETGLDSSFASDLQAAFAACAIELNASREREGSALALHILSETAGIQEKTAEIGSIRQDAAHQFHERLRERLAELLGNSSVSEARLAEEAAILADRSDIAEEVTRLYVHATELRRLVETGGEIGKRLDFLLQEMNRETNTVLSKTSGIGEIGLKITSLGLAIKAHIEKAREQALNLE